MRTDKFSLPAALPAKHCLLSLENGRLLITNGLLPRMGTVIETNHDIDLLMENTRPSVGLPIDTVQLTLCVRKC